MFKKEVDYYLFFESQFYKIYRDNIFFKLVI